MRLCDDNIPWNKGMEPMIMHAKAHGYLSITLVNVAYKYTQLLYTKVLKRVILNTKLSSNVPNIFQN